MTAKRTIALAIAAIALVCVVGVSMSLRSSFSTLSTLGSNAPMPGSAPRRLTSSGLAQEPSGVASATPADTASTSRGDIAEELEEVWDCIGARDFICASMILSRLRATNDLTDPERGQVLYAAAALEVAQGNRNEAIRILEGQMSAIADLSDEFRGRMKGILASLYFWERRFAEALEAVDAALALAPQDSLVDLRKTVVAELLDSSANHSDRSSRDQRSLILLDQVVE
ncbi:MAG: hypothetical protein PVH89_07555 [Gammaproteobacteria bacterium]|jgi:tetratricopeptide (TPR) repeat protein